jgi:hypothetical protein
MARDHPGLVDEALDVFISYARDDRAVATSLNDSLQRRGLHTWMDVNLRVGTDWATEISEALTRSAVVIVIVTPRSLDSEWVQAEWATALQSSRRIVPVLAEGATFGDLPQPLAMLQGVDLNTDFEDGVKRIIDAVGSLKRSGGSRPRDVVDMRALVEDIVETKLLSLGVGKTTRSRSPGMEDSDLVFVVSSFDTDMEPAFEAVEAAAKIVGLRAERVKDVVGDYRITDKILEMIRAARLVVVDLTHERPNVYFELGYARGLGKTVVTILRTDTPVHFDVQDWTHLRYSDSRPLERDLVDRFRIELQRRAEPPA